MSERTFWTYFWFCCIGAEMVAGWAIFDALHLIGHHP